MYTKLSDVKLKTGENMEIGVVLTPDKEYADRITDLLHHKGEPWLTHVNKALIRNWRRGFILGTSASRS